MGDKYNVTSHNQQGGISAGQVNIGKPPRKLDANLKRQLDGAVADHAHKEVEIKASHVSEDCLEFGRQVKEYLEAKGFKVGDVCPAMIFGVPYKFNVVVESPVIRIQIT